MHICVLGGGVIGTTTAYYLARDGHDVTVIEQNAEPGSAASYANGGQLSYSYVVPLAGPSAIAHLPGWLLSRNGPLRFSPALNIDQWRWCLAFLRQCTRSRSRRTTAELLELGAYSRQMLHQLVQDEQLDFDYRNSGKLILYRDPQEFDGARELMRFQAGFGSMQKALTPGECVATETALASLEGRLAGGIFTPSEDSGDCHLFTRNLAALTARKYGVRFLYGVQLTGMRTERGRLCCAQTNEGDIAADAFVVALGNDSRRVLKPLGIDIPVYPLKGYSLTVPIGDTHTAPSISITDLHHKMVYARLGAHLRIAGMVDITGPGTAGDRHRLELLARQAQETLPNAGDYAHARAWTGARPATPDSKPLLGRCSFGNLWLNTGQGALGFTLACASGKLVADAIAGRSSELRLDPYSFGSGRSSGVSPGPTPAVALDQQSRSI